MSVEKDDTPDLKERLRKELLEDDKLLANAAIELDSEDDEEEDNDEDEDEEDD